MADYRAVAKQKARKYGLDPNIFVRQIQQESGFQPRVSSSAGAQGIAQIMPDTARAWGVNPNDPVAALDAAARNMAQYVKKFGSYEKALRAYNAGEGNLQRSYGFKETNHYVATILANGRDPKKLGAKSAGGSTPAGSPRAGGVTTTVKTPGTTRLQQTESTVFDQAGYDKAAKLASLKGILEGFNKGKPSLFASVLPDSADPAAFTSTKTGVKTIRTPGSTITTTTPGGAKQPAATSSGGGGSGKKIPGLSGKGSGLLELIYNDGGKGYGVKNKQIVNGASVFSSVWAGHANHVHVAAGPKTIVGLGKLAQQMGLHVGENSHFGGENPGAHVPGSYHNRDMAIDVSAPMTPAGKALMKRYAATVQRVYFGK